MKNNYHFIGIGGIGMSGLARIMLSKQSSVSGSDIHASTVIEGLSKEGAKISIGHSPDNISPGMKVVYSTDIKKDNPEYQAAITKKCALLHRSELLQLIIANSQTLAVTGTHGKTTTSSLLAWVLNQCGLFPSFMIGGIVPQLKSNAGLGSGKHFVIEACESDGTFLNYTPYGSIVTNIDLDHVSHYGSENALIEAFKTFMAKVASPDHLFWCGDDQRLKLLGMPGISYGFNEGCLLRALYFIQNEWTVRFDAEFQGRLYPNIEVSLLGKHNALNALAVFGLALSLGADENKIREALRSFGGVKRRCEKVGEAHGVLFLDDYGHHPTEIKATLRGIRQAIGERRLIVAYQPHRYTRAKECIGLYRGVFDDADLVFVTELYEANEAPIPGITRDLVFNEIQGDLKDRCRFIERAQLPEALSASLRPHDVFVSLGAGDITKVGGEVLSRFKAKAPRKLKAGVVMGGQSVEHEVSLRSSEHILASLRSDFYEVDLFGITRQGNWIAGPNTKDKLQSQNEIQASLKMAPEVLVRLQECDIVFPVLHGTYGEDGTIQGFFEILGLAYVGCDHRSAAISMDKAVTKALLLQAGIATSPFVSFSRAEWDADCVEIVQKVRHELRYPLFVKPSHLGSSIGVKKVMEEASLGEAVEYAFRFDTHIVIENGIDGREIEFAVVGNDHVSVFPPGEILTGGQIYDYEGKYSADGTKTAAQADLSADLINEGIDIVRHAYTAMRCTGMARIDTFLDKSGKFWLNEINPIPGCTKNSLYPQMCAAHGLAGCDLIDKLIILGLQRKRAIDRLETKP